MRRTLSGTLALAMMASAGLATTASAQSFTAYREVFPNKSSTNQGQLAIDQGWKGGQHDNPIANPPDGQISVSAGSTELTPINSNPVGPIPPVVANTGFAFYSPDQRAGVDRKSVV